MSSSAPFIPRVPWPSGLVVPVPIDPSGQTGPTPAQARGPRCRRVARNRYVPSTTPPGPDQRIVELYSAVPGWGALTGWAALRVLGGGYFDGRPLGQGLPVPVAVGRGSGRRTPRGTTLSYEALQESEVVVRHGMRLTVPHRALFDELRRPGAGREAVVAFDMAAAAILVLRDEMRAYVAERPGWRRSGLARRAVALGHPASRSPAESRLRLIWVLDAGLPPPRVNREVFDLDERLICIPDLFDEAAGLVVEFDGAEHRWIGRHTQDVRREEACRDAGLEYCKVTGLDLREPELVVRRLLAARHRALSRPPGRRGWTLTYPPGYVPWIRFPTKPRF